MRRLLGVLRHDEPAPRRAAARGWPTCPRWSTPPGGPGCRSSCRWPAALGQVPAGVGGLRVPDRAGIAVQRAASTRPAPRSPCRWAAAATRCCSGWPTARRRRPGANGSAGPAGTAPSRARADRDAGAGRRCSAARCRPGRCPAAASWCRPGSRWARRRDGRAARQAAATTRCLIADDQAMVREGFAAVLAAQPGLVVVGPGRGRRRRGPADPAAAAGRGADGRPDAGPGRAAGHPRRSCRGSRPGPAAGAHAHHVRPGRVRVRGAAGRGQRVPAQGRHRRRAGPRGPGGGGGRRAARPVGDPAADRRLRRAGRAQSAPAAAPRSARSPSGRPRCCG